MGATADQGSKPGHRRGFTDAVLWLLYIAALLLLARAVLAAPLPGGAGTALVAIGAVGAWRYSVGVMHWLRAMCFLFVVFPRHKRAAAALSDDAGPSQVFVLVTSFRIDARTTWQVYEAAMREAIDCGFPATVVASIVEMGDERLIKTLWQRLQPPPRVALHLVRIAGSGKRDGLAQGFRAISRAMPEADAVVAVVDGDTVLSPGVIRLTVPYLKLFPNVGGLTTNEFCRVEGSRLMNDWHELRFAQRHIAMCSMALSKRVLTLTGRMSVFRAGVIANPGFIADVENDHLDHWRLGRFKFLTGDDKSSWYSLMRLGYDTYYVPDASILTVEHPPDKRFLRASRTLMFRWYGNSLRQNGRASRLGLRRLGLFTRYVLIDQRVSMWTSLFGLCMALASSLRFGAVILLGYALWIGATRLVMSMLLLPGGHRIGPLFPLMLYYNQIVGSITKIHVFFHLDRQSWTRQKTTLQRDLDAFRQRFNPVSSRALLYSAWGLFSALIFGLAAR